MADGSLDMIMHSLGTEAAAGSVIKFFLKESSKPTLETPSSHLTPITSSIINMAFLRQYGGCARSEPRAQPSNCSKKRVYPDYAAALPTFECQKDG